MTNTVTIADRGGMRALLVRLRDLLDELDAADDSAPLTEALAAAACGKSTGLLGGITGALEPTADGSCAPVYAEVAGAVNGVITAAGKHIAAARASVQAAISDMERLVSGIDGTDDAGAVGVRAAS